jgi:flavin-binding protein dodecin
MADAAFKLTKLVGESDQGIEQAVKVALATSAERVHGQTWCHVTDIRANIDESGTVDRWQVEVEVAFKVDD